MYHSLYHKKDTNEDPKTSAVFETLLMLPDEVVWHVVRNACFDSSNLPEFAGRIESCRFWPHWDSTDTTNANFVEPDVFIRFQAFDLIIEAKYGDVDGQYRGQWKNELRAYRNEYGNERTVHFLAVGGNAEKHTESVNIDRAVAINKCSWLSLLIQVTKFKDDILSATFKTTYNSYILRQLDLIELAFNLNGVYDIKWMGDLEVAKPRISLDSIETLKRFFPHE